MSITDDYQKELDLIKVKISAHEHISAYELAALLSSIYRLETSFSLSLAESLFDSIQEDNPIYIAACKNLLAAIYLDGFVTPQNKSKARSYLSLSDEHAAWVAGGLIELYFR